MMHLKISVITPSLNQGQFIEYTIQSVLNQNYPNLEYIIIDGGSTDETISIINRYQNQLILVSESDTGQANAINKGFMKATGDVICWLNSDDEYMPDTLHTVADYFLEHPDANFLYGDALAIDAWGRSYGKRGNVKPATFEELASKGDFVVQPAAFWRSRLLHDVGYLDETLQYCMDYEFWLRVAQKYPLNYIPKTLARERFHVQAKTTRASLQRIYEIERVAQRYGHPGIPTQFRAEQTAVFLVETVRTLFRAEWTEALFFLKQTLNSFHPSIKIFPHTLAFVLGSRGATWLRLHYDFIRGLLRRIGPNST